MLFDAAAFEQYFSERDLRKGYQLYESGAVSLLSRNNVIEARYHIGTEEGVLKKKSSRVLSWNCGCGNDYCQHLAALMFHLHQSKFELPQGKLHKKQFNPSAQLPAGSKLFSSGLQKLEKYSKKVHQHTLRFHKLKVIDSKNASSLRQEILQSFNGEFAQINSEDGFYLALATLKELIHLYVKLDHNALQEINQLSRKLYATLERNYKKGLKEEQALAFKKVTIESIKNNRALYSPAFTFLIPRMLLLPPDNEETRELRSTLHKRIYLLKNAVDFDPVIIARHQLLILQKGDFFAENLKFSGREPEYFIALAELYLVAKRRKKAFAILVGGMENLEKATIQYQEYLENALSKAKENNMPVMERRFLREILIYGLFIRPGDLERFIQLSETSDTPGELSKLQKEIRNSDPYYFDKMSLLLMAGHQFDELIDLIAKQTERFMLLHEVVMKKGGVPDQKLLALYRKHLLCLLQKTENVAMHQKVITKALHFFERVPSVQRSNICEELLDQIGRNKPVYRYLESALHSPNLPA